MHLNRSANTHIPGYDDNVDQLNRLVFLTLQLKIQNNLKNGMV